MLKAPPAAALVGLDVQTLSLATTFRPISGAFPSYPLPDLRAAVESVSVNIVVPVALNANDHAIY